MKLNGRPLPGPAVETVVIPRGSHFEDVEVEEGGEKKIVHKEVFDDLVFECQAVLDFSDFEKLCPVPNPPKSMKPGQQVATPDFENPKYKKAIADLSGLQQDWMILKSLDATPGIEWEKVQRDKPETWKLWQDELKDGGLTIGEILKIQQGVITANGLDDTKMTEARERFLAAKRQLPKA